jgi:hypothetical protein
LEIAERNALQERSDRAVAAAIARGSAAEAAELSALARASCAVLNVDIFYLRELVARGNSLHSNYHQGMRAETRKAAEALNDQHRLIVDAAMFGSYSNKIHFAALSPDGRGLDSYGAYAMRLREIAIEKRSSVVEENSFEFVEHHRLASGETWPLGYRSTWTDRSLLVLAKLGDMLVPGLSKESLCQLMIYSDGNRANDQFLEVHIYGGFDGNAVESVRGPKPKRADYAAVWKVVKEVLAVNGKTVEEV